MALITTAVQSRVVPVRSMWIPFKPLVLVFERLNAKQTLLKATHWTSFSGYQTWSWRCICWYRIPQRSLIGKTDGCQRRRTEIEEDVFYKLRNFSKSKTGVCSAHAGDIHSLQNVLRQFVDLTLHFMECISTENCIFIRLYVVSYCKGLGTVLVGSHLHLACLPAITLRLMTLLSWIFQVTRILIMAAEIAFLIAIKTAMLLVLISVLSFFLLSFSVYPLS